MNEWTADAAEAVAKIPPWLVAEVEYRITLKPAVYRTVLNFFEQLTGAPPKKTVDAVLSFVGNSRVHMQAKNVTCVEIKQTRLSDSVEWFGHTFRSVVSTEKALKPGSARCRALADAASQHMSGPKFQRLRPDTVVKWCLQPIACQAGVCPQWLHDNCAKIEWRVASKRDRAFVNQPVTIGDVFLPFACVSAHQDPAAPQKVQATVSPEAPINVRHRTRHTFEWTNEHGFKFYIDCTSSSETHPGSKPQLTVEIEAATPRDGPNALWLPREVTDILSDAEARCNPRQECGVDGADNY
jgi:hypothetical protein